MRRFEELLIYLGQIFLSKVSVVSLLQSLGDHLFVLCLHVTPGDGGGGDGSSGSEESGNDGGVSTIPLPPTVVQTTYDVLRGLGIVGSSAVGEDEDGDLNMLGHGRNSLSRHTEVRMRHTSTLYKHRCIIIHFQFFRSAA